MTDKQPKALWLADMLEKGFRVDGPDSEAAAELRRLYALCSRAMVQPDGWQPIETAPTDDTPVDIWRPSWGGERCTAMCRIDLGRGNIFYAPTKSGPACVRDATHWMPIPEAPK